MQSLQSGRGWGSWLGQGSAILLCRVSDISAIAPGMRAEPGIPYVLLYSAEGLKEDVTVELGNARDVLQAEGGWRVSELAFSGSEAWAGWMGGAPRDALSMRLGVAPKELPGFLLGLAPSSQTFFIADIANGQLYLQGEIDIRTVRESAREAGGYAIVLSAPEARYADLDVWGSSTCPATLDLMRALKARWDPRRMLNPGAFLT